MNGFPVLIVEHFCVKFGNLSCIYFFRYLVGKTDKQTEIKTLPPHTTIGVGNEMTSSRMYHQLHFLQLKSRLEANVKCPDPTLN